MLAYFGLIMFLLILNVYTFMVNPLLVIPIEITSHRIILKLLLNRFGIKPGGFEVTSLDDNIIWLFG
jgi:hypothetical protein